MSEVFTVATLNLCNIEGTNSQRVGLKYNLTLGHQQTERESDLEDGYECPKIADVSPPFLSQSSSASYPSTTPNDDIAPVYSFSSFTRTQNYHTPSFYLSSFTCNRQYDFATGSQFLVVSQDPFNVPGPRGRCKSPYLSKAAISQI
jgi:hypothetical protein